MVSAQALSPTRGAALTWPCLLLLMRGQSCCRAAALGCVVHVGICPSKSLVLHDPHNPPCTPVRLPAWYLPAFPLERIVALCCRSWRHACTGACPWSRTATVPASSALRSSAAFALQVREGVHGYAGSEVDGSTAVSAAPHSAAGAMPDRDAQTVAQPMDVSRMRVGSPGWLTLSAKRKWAVACRTVTEVRARAPHGHALQAQVQAQVQDGLGPVRPRYGPA